MNVGCNPLDGQGLAKKVILQFRDQIRRRRCGIRPVDAAAIFLSGRREPGQHGIGHEVFTATHDHNPAALEPDALDRPRQHAGEIDFIDPFPLAGREDHA